MTTTINVKRIAVAVVALAGLVLSSPHVTRAQIDDHLKCYKIKDAHKFKAVVDLAGAELGAELGCEVKIKGSLFCVPAIKQVVSSDSPTVTFNGQVLEDDRICYKMKCPVPAPADQTVADQFGTRSVSKLKPSMLCTPAAKILSGSCPTRLDFAVQSRGANETPTRVESGWNGLGHKDDMPEGHALALAVSGCDNASPPCGDCTAGGVSLMQGRCVNDPTITCDALNANDTECSGNRCDYFAFPWQPVHIGGNPVCLRHRLTTSPSASFNNETGSGNLAFNTLTDTFLGIAQMQPCPVCVGDTIANDGIAVGTCDGGSRNNLSCDANASDPTFGVTSFDCPPSSGVLLTGAGVARSLNLTTGVSSLPFADSCDAPLGTFDCACGACSLDPTKPCETDVDCTGFGTCNNGGGAPRAPNDCQTLTCVDQGNEQGQCGTAGADDDLFCNGVSRADGKGIITCSSNADCTALDSECPGNDCGDCTVVERRTCFLDPIDARGNPDATSPLMADALCVPAASSGAVNAAYGWPGPERLRLQYSVTRF